MKTEGSSQNQPSQPSEKKIIMLRTLGKGSFGKVKEALHVASNEKLAIKILEKEKIVSMEDEVRVRREIDILMKVNHPHVVQVYEVVTTSKYYFFMMENALGGEMSNYLESKGR